MDGWVYLGMELCVHVLLILMYYPEPDTAASSCKSLELPTVDKCECIVLADPRRPKKIVWTGKRKF